MKYMPFGQTGVKVSQLGFGTMSFGGDADASTSAQLYAACRDAGVNLFDTADVYSGGESERILGKLIAPHRDEIVLCTKSYFPTGDAPNARGNSRFHLVRAVEASLSRLKTDRVDVLYLHRWDDLTALDSTLRALEDLVRAGKILYPALSNVAAWQAQKALGTAALCSLSPVVAIQPMYNLLKRQAEVEILPMAKEARLAVIPYSPLGGGLLSGKFRGETPSNARLASNKMYQTRYAGTEQHAARFADLAESRGLHPVSLAVAWVCAHPAVTAPLIGARSLTQLAPALNAVKLALSPTLRAEISALTPSPPPATDRSEESTAHNYGTR